MKVETATFVRTAITGVYRLNRRYYVVEGDEARRAPDFSAPDFYERVAAIRRELKTPRSYPIPDDVGSLGGIIEKSARARAKKYGRIYSLPKGWVAERIRSTEWRCEATGCELRMPVRKHDPWSPSLDRINPKLGYTEDNCRVVSYIFNCALNQFSEDDLRKMCQAFLATRLNL